MPEHDAFILGYIQKAYPKVYNEALDAYIDYSNRRAFAEIAEWQIHANDEPPF